MSPLQLIFPEVKLADFFLAAIYSSYYTAIDLL
jgi:hypothetical protein